MENVIFLIFRRMRAPLLALIVTYVLAILGLVLIPGQDGDGNPWRMDFFHAFYVVSYMATTIGFGELPYPFTGLQRLWIILSIYGTVVAWLYSFGTLIALFQDKNFQRAVTELMFARRVRSRREPFYLVCGYGETGTMLVRALTERNRQAVAIDIDERRIDLLKLENLRQYVPALCADARSVEHLIEAGIKHRLCVGVVALTNVNETNLKIAIATKLMRPDIKAICRADSHDIEANMASFGTDHIYDPFDIFADYLAAAIQAPCLTLLYEWLTALPGDQLRDSIYPPAQGSWVLCGYGRFGKAIYRYLESRGVELIVVEQDPDRAGKLEGRYVVGCGTEAVTLEQAEIRRAVGLVAGVSNDADNLSIIMTARALNPDLFVVARENQLDNQELFDAVKADIVMHPSSIIANRIRVLLTTPLLIELEGHARRQNDEWARRLISRIAGIVDEQVPEVWEISIDETHAYAVSEAVSKGSQVTIENLLQDPRDRERRLSAIPLLLLNRDNPRLLPPEDTRLDVGDRLLLCGRSRTRSRMSWTQQNIYALDYILTGRDASEGWLSRRVSKSTNSSNRGC